MEQGNQQGFTPGPWFTDGIAKYDSSHVISSHAQKWIAAALDFNTFARDAEVQANARLIAAAPELLGALTRLADYTFETGEYLTESHEALQSVVDAAIAKALGK